MKKSVNIPIWVVIVVAIAIGVVGTLTLKPFVYDIYLSSTVDKEPDLSEAEANYLFTEYVEDNFLFYHTHRSYAESCREAIINKDTLEISYNYEAAKWEARLIPSVFQRIFYDKSYDKSWAGSNALFFCTGRADTTKKNAAGKQSAWRSIDSIVRLYIDEGTDKVYTQSSPWSYRYEN